VGPGALDKLLETPGALDSLAEELGVAAASSAPSLVELLESIRRRAIHLSVTPSEFRGLSVEEIIVLTAYESSRFDQTAWKREVRRQPAPHELHHVCRAWLMQRARIIASGKSMGQPRWPMVGGASLEPHRPEQLMIAVAPFADSEALAAELEPLMAEAHFAHEHYVACTPATALGYLGLQARRTQPPRWDSLVLERKLRGAGVGLLLVEPDGVLLHLPARYDSHPPEPRLVELANLTVGGDAKMRKFREA